MTLEQVKAMLDTTGLPVAYRAFPENLAPTLPYICYYVTGSDNFSADNRVYSTATSINIELYSALKDIVSEAKVETALASVFWNKNETYIDSEKCYQILYTIEV